MNVKKVKKNLRAAFKLFFAVFKASPLCFDQDQYREYENCFDEKLSTLPVFTSIVIKIASELDCNRNAQSKVTVTQECNLFFEEVIPVTIKSVKKWCTANRAYLDKGVKGKYGFTLPDQSTAKLMGVVALAMPMPGQSGRALPLVCESAGKNIHQHIYQRIEFLGTISCIHGAKVLVGQGKSIPLALPQYPNNLLRLICYVPFLPYDARSATFNSHHPLPPACLACS